MFSFWILDVKRSSKVEKRIRERVAADLCLMVFDDGTECDGKMYSGGNCQRCANSFQYELSRLPSQKARTKFRGNLIERGLMLRPQEQRKLRRLLLVRSVLARQAAAVANQPCVEVA